MTKALEFFYFEISGMDPGTGAPVKGMLDKFAICTQSEARRAAHTYEQDLAQREPERRLKVYPVGQEKVGPAMQRQLKIVMASAEQQRIAAEMLAAKLAQYVAKASLEISPNISKIAHDLLEDARKSALIVVQMQNKASAGGTA